MKVLEDLRVVLPLYVVVDYLAPSAALQPQGPNFCEAKIWGTHTRGETPVPIPNTAVKPFKAYGSVLVRVCESR